MKTFLNIMAMSAMLFTAPTLLANELVINGDFETDVEEFVVWPGYVGGANDAGDSNPNEVPEWFGSGGRGINPVFAPSNPPEINSWIGTGGRGINPVDSGEAPFRDNGENESFVAFLQGNAGIAQDITGLSVGTNYTLSWEFNARDCCGDIPIGGLTLNGSEIDVSEYTEEIFPVGGIEPWYFAEHTFEAESSNLSLEFFGMAAAGGDATLLVDNIGLFAEGGTTNVVQNGDFETDPEDFEVWPGYTGSGAGDNAPFRDNGDNDTAVAFLQGAANLGQVVEGLVVGEEYTLSMDINARNCCGDIPIGELYIDGDFMEDFPEPGLDGIVEPVGGTQPWYNYEMTFVAESASMELLIQASPLEGGDSTLIVDNVSVLGATSVVPGDFNNDGLLTAIDIDLLSEEVRTGTNLPEFDLNADSLVNDADRAIWVDELKFTYFGDSNLDGQFNSSDLVLVFTRGKYEDGVPFNAGWADGDWNGDAEFNSSDFVTAFAGGGFEQGPRQAAQVVPEPASASMALLGALLLVALRRRK